MKLKAQGGVTIPRPLAEELHDYFLNRVPMGQGRRVVEELERALGIAKNMLRVDGQSRTASDLMEEARAEGAAKQVRKRTR